MIVAPRHTAFDHCIVRILALIVVGCGATAPAPVAPGKLPASKPLTIGAAVDPFAVLAETAGEVSWLMVGKARLDDGGATFEATKAAPPIPVRIVEQHGNTVRAA